jgi:peptidylprolyl isomerase/peptidyl-prolyl cis-trans isomerase B (cyclophilin B)
MKRQKYLTLMIVLLILILAAGCQSNLVTEAEETSIDIKDADIGHSIVQIEMEDGGIMVFELYPEFAPETVENFVELVESGFYDGLKFHRIIKDFMIQGGDPEGDGTGGSDKTIPGEFAKNKFSQNTLKHTRGVISMARSKNPDSASSQFFIMDGTASSLDGSYAAFGKLIEGEDTLSLIAKTEVVKNPMSGEKSSPVKDMFIKKVTFVETK